MRLAALLFCASLSAQTGVNFYSLEKEKALGQQIAAEYRRHNRILDSAPVNAYLDALGQRLAAGQPFTYTFELVDDEQAWIHEPQAFPGGPVFVPATLIMAAADEDELAAMLAHAIAHIATRQDTRQLTRGQLMNQAAQPLIFMGGWSGNALPLGFRTMQRKNELQSDQFAIGLLAAAGYPPQALARYVERVQPDGTNPTAPYPDKDERLAALQTAIDHLPPNTYPAHPGLDAIQQEVAKLIVRPAGTPPRTPPRLSK